MSPLESVLRKTASFLNPKKSKSHSNPPEHSESITDSGDSSESEQAKYHSIKAFRTIITMLELIPSERATAALDRIPGRNPEDKELKLLNAVATLLVRVNEVAAVAVTEHNNGSGVIKVIACLHVANHSDSSSGEFTNPGIFKNFLATFNPRKDNPNFMSHTNYPVIIDPKDEIPSKLRETEDIAEIYTYYYSDIW
jgi:hypothetical protein